MKLIPTKQFPNIQQHVLVYVGVLSCGCLNQDSVEMSDFPQIWEKGKGCFIFFLTDQFSKSSLF